MDDLLGKVEREIPVVLREGEGTLFLCERGIIYEGSNVNGRVAAPYNYIKTVSLGRELPLGQMEAYIVLHDLMGDKFELEFAANELHLNEIKRRCTPGR